MIKTNPLILKKHNGEEPQKHLKEPYVPDFTQYSNKGYAQAVEEPLNYKKRPNLYPISWGWNADGRAGNATRREIREPQIAHKSAMRNYIQGDAGTHHSLLVSEQGIVYSFGNGRKGQLGYSNEFMTQQGVIGPKGGKQQTCPRRVTPSGNLLFGTDIKIAQVAAGRFFSVCRQLSIDEGMSTVAGLHESCNALQAHLVMFPDSVPLQKAWSEVRQEKQKISRISGGALMSWGTGTYGELGHGVYSGGFECKPRIIERLMNVSIIQISAGRHHVLAISSVHQLYSWGSGKSGKLGHGHLNDVHSPEFVCFFDKYYVEYCSAGDNHSAVLTRTKKGERNKQLRRVACFGKGAHGRLGNNRNHPPQVLPVLVDIWPPSLKGVQIHSVSCGGAHTLALCYRTVKKGLANPWGRETYVAAWGYGRNGQLGNGYTVDSFTPLKVRMPEKCVLICEIAAGRSWSMARSIGGELYTWGKGLRGQLGQGKAKFSLIPRKVKSFASFVGLSAGFGHNVCISTPKKVYSPKLSQLATTYPDPFDCPISLGLSQRESESLYKFNCCKRDIHPLRARMRFMCKECNINCICIVCAKQCHRGHTLTERLPVEREARIRQMQADEKKRKVVVKIADNDRQAAQKLQRKINKKGKKKRKKRKGQDDEKPVLMTIKTGITVVSYKAKLRKLQNTKIPFCMCSMYNQKCLLLPAIAEENADLLDKDGESVSRIERVKHAVLDDLGAGMRQHQAAICIQRQAQWYLGRKNIQKVRKYMSDLRRIAATNVWKEQILAPIWDKLERSKSKFREGRERSEMELEEDIKRKYDYYYASQIACSACNAMFYAVDRWLGAQSVAIPRIIRGEVATKEEHILASNAFSWTSIRHMQLKLHPKKRINVALLAKLTKHLPRDSWHEGQFRDADLVSYTQRFVRDISTERWRAKRVAAVEAKVKAREKALAAARAILLQQKLGGKAALAKADQLQGKGPVATKPLSRAEIAARTLKQRAEDLKALNKKVEDELAADRRPFDIYDIPKDKYFRIRRRNTLSNPQKMYSRLISLRESIPQQLIARRRNSEPMKMSRLYSEQVPNYEAFAGAKASLNVFHTRFRLLEEYIRPEHAQMWSTMEDRVKNKRIKRLFAYSWLTPRLPLEMRTMLQGSSRRRTIADPERLAAQMHVMFECRNFFAQGRAKAAEVEKLRVRRRSFDLGEEADEKDGITAALGYEYEEPYKQPTLSELRRDSALMENRMIFAGIAKSKGPKSKANAPDFSGFKAKETMQQRIERELREAEEKNKNLLDATNSTRQERAAAAGANKPRMGRVKRSKKQTDVEDGELDGTTAKGEAVIWHEYFSDLGETYYYNAQTGESTWEFPMGDDNQVMSQYQDEAGNYYWYNWTTGETQWA